MQRNNENAVENNQQDINTWANEFLPSQWDNEALQPEGQHEQKNNKRLLEDSQSISVEDLEPLGEDELSAELEEALAEAKMVELRPILTIPDSYTPLLKQGLENLYRFLKQLSPTNQLGLRAHQPRALIEFCHGLMDGKRKSLFDYPTGTGKTILFKTLVEVMFGTIRPKPEILVATSRIEVSKQIKEVLGHAFSVDVVTYAKLKLNLAKNPVAANRFGKKVSYYHAFDMIIFDEAHNSLAEKGVELGKQVEAAIQETGAIWCCFTATPSYNIRKAKGFQDVSQLMSLTPVTNPVTPYSLAEAIVDGALAPVRTAVLTPKLDQATVDELSAREINNSNNEINEQKVQRIIDRPHFNQLVVNSYANGKAPNGTRFLGMQGIVFCMGTLHADHVAEQLNNSLLIDSHPVLRQLREDYVRTMREKALAARQHFSEETVRRQFKIAQSIHSETRLITLTSSMMAEALRLGGYQEAGEKFYRFKDEEKQNLQRAVEKGDKQWSFYLPSLTLEQREVIRKGFLDGRYLLLTGADILTEGCDFVKAKFIFNYRATKSKVTKVQTCGRGLRYLLNSIAYIIDVNWGIRGQLFFHEFLGGKMSLGRMPDISLPSTPIPTFDLPEGAGIKELIWEPTGVKLTPGTKKRRTEGSKNSTKTMITEEEFERSLQRTEEKLQSFSSMVKRYSMALNETDSVKVNYAPASAVVSNQANEAVRSRTNRRGNNETGNTQPIADRTMPFTRSAKEKMAALTEQMKAGIEDLQAFIGCLKSMTEEDRPSKKSRSGNSAIGQHTEQQHHTSQRSAPVDQVILKLQATSERFSRLLSQVTNQMNQGVNVCASSSASGGILREIAPEEIESQVQQLETQLKTIEESNELEKIMEHIKQVRTTRKKAEEERIQEERRRAEQQRIEEERRRAEQQTTVEQGQAVSLNLQPSQLPPPLNETSLQPIANNISQAQTATPELNSDDLIMFISNGLFKLEELLHCTNTTVLAIVNDFLARNVPLSAFEIKFLVQCAKAPNLETWKNYITKYWKDLKILITNRVLQPEHLECLDPNIEKNTKLNIEMLFNSPSTFGPEALKNLFDLGFKFQDLYACESSLLVHGLLKHANMLASRFLFKSPLISPVSLLHFDPLILDEVLTTVGKAAASNPCESILWPICRRLFSRSHVSASNVEEFLVKTLVECITPQVDSQTTELAKTVSFEKAILDHSQNYSTALIAYLFAIIKEKADVETCTAMISVASLHTDVAMARAAFNRACQFPSSTDAHYREMLKLAYKLNDFALASGVYNKARQEGKQTSLGRMMIIIAGNSPGRYATAKSVFQQLQTKSIATYELMIQLAGENNDIEFAKTVFNEARQVAVNSLLPHLAMIKMASKHGHIELALQTFNNLHPLLQTATNQEAIFDALVKNRYFNALTERLAMYPHLKWEPIFQPTMKLGERSYGVVYLGLRQALIAHNKPELITVNFTNERQLEAVKDLCHDYPDRFSITQVNEEQKFLILDYTPALTLITDSSGPKPQTDFFRQSSPKREEPPSRGGPEDFCKTM